MLRLVTVHMLSKKAAHEEPRIRYLNQYHYPNGEILVDEDDTISQPEVLYRGESVDQARLVIMIAIEQARQDGYRWRLVPTEETEHYTVALQRQLEQGDGPGYPWHNPGKWLIP